MKLEEGKFYKTRSGLKFGPAEAVNPFGSSCWVVPSNNGHPATYDSYGNRISPCCSNEEDLVSEWHDGPVRTVTRREIVPGIYGKVFINCYDEFANTVSLNVKEDFGCVSFNAEELREAAHLLNQLAEFMEEQQ